MDPSVYGAAFCAKRGFSHQQDDADLAADIEGTPRRMFNMAKRRQLVRSNRSADYRNVDSPGETLDLISGHVNRYQSTSMDALPNLLQRRNCGSGNDCSPPRPCPDGLSDYRQLAQSQFRRLYYDLSRGIGIRDEGLSYLFKSGVNDISTSTYGMYGEIRPSCLHKICAEMQRFGLDNRSVILDLGSGRGAPNFLFSHRVQVFASIGIELCPVGYASSVHNLVHYLKVDVSRLICEVTGFGQNLDIRPFTPVGEKECPVGICDTDTSLKTPVTKRLSMLNGYSCNSSPASKQTTQSDSVTTQYQSYSMYADDTCATPVALTSSRSNSDDGCEYYRALHRFSTLPSTLGVGFCNEDIAAFDNFNGASHVYSFDVAMEKALVNNMVRQFINTRTAWLFASFNGDLIEHYELSNCFLASRVPCQMYKSGERRCCYIYVKRDWQLIKREHDAQIEELFGLSTSVIPAHVEAMPAIPVHLAHPSDALGLNLCTAGCRFTMPIPPIYRKPAQFHIAAAPRTTKSVLLSRFNEPVDVLELVKLTKMPLEVQLGWYLLKISRPDVVLTRSKRINSLDNMRRSLCEDRSKLLEIIATSPEPTIAMKYVGNLQRHIRQQYMPVRCFPTPTTWEDSA
ncbi:uncharacterized protein BXIN_0999 [Babesia sp. Xinjiang]|uniref:uncharacterized protein n=1 Tax=Babesia sp. Xinjiang TaxID=462227 RepID=UPI000A265B53|nr:uncharacterized protein BXIN_0999 [Babesia sp. Xinjiang]ORM42202.1 hypothetical protein BXIN_0999 [Babesia sp. Xinjiang]